MQIASRERSLASGYLKQVNVLFYTYVVISCNTLKAHPLNIPPSNGPGLSLAALA